MTIKSEMKLEMDVFYFWLLLITWMAESGLLKSECEQGGKQNFCIW